MANLRRQKLKAKRAGCNVKEVDDCETVSGVIELMNALPNQTKLEDPDGSS